MAPKTNTIDKKHETVNTESITVGNDSEQLLAASIAAIPAGVTGSARDSIIAAMKVSILKSEADMREARITADIKWLCDNGFRTVAEKTERAPCTCGVGRHTENTDRCEAYITELRSKIAKATNEKTKELHQSYLQRELKKKAVVTA